jgi:hypothetical protein
MGFLGDIIESHDQTAKAKCYLMHYLYSCAEEFVAAAKRMGIECDSRLESWGVISRGAFGREKKGTVYIDAWLIATEHVHFPEPEDDELRGTDCSFYYCHDGTVRLTKEGNIKEMALSFGYRDDFSISELEWNHKRTDVWNNCHNIQLGDSLANPTSMEEARSLVDNHLKSLLGIPSTTENSSA